jgi:LuxR family maltose regulon positive regulatory protein
LGLHYSPARTKLLIPELPAAHVPRPRLVQRLDDSVRAFAITLVAGFAGSGKTMLLAEFARSRPPGTIAWLSCDVTDADPVQFWTAVVGALRVFDGAIGADALDLLDVDGHLGHDAVASLVNDLLDFDGDGLRLLVIDDLHLAARSALEPLGELLERLPPRVRVALSVRSDPRLPLHRWRAGGRLGEVRAQELQMDAAEVAQFLHTVGIELSLEDAAVLADRTEGWAAGVQLAALSMRYEREPAEFIHTFAGTDRNVAEFLVGEVLQRQPDDAVAFLLDTSVLDELSAPLCDALTNRADGAAMLHRLERDNLFIVPLDNEQALYRYHHLFGELLRRLLAARHPGRAFELHRAASHWYADHEDARRAVRHAILAQDPALVTAILRDHLLAEFFTGTSEMVREWVAELSRSHVDMPYELMLEYAIALTMAGALEDARGWLDRVERTLPDDARPASRARLAIANALTIGLLGEIELAMDAAQHARQLVEPGVDSFIDGALPQVLLRSYVYTDDLLAARALYERSRPQPGDPEQLDHVILTGIFSQAELEAGELESARVYADAAMATMAKLGAERHFGFNETLRTLGSVAYEWDDLDEAEQLLERCIEIVRVGRPAFLLQARLELARVWNARNDPVAALAELELARAAVRPDVRSPLTDRVDAYRARLLAEGGEIEGARELVTRLRPGRRRSIVEIRCHLAEQNVEAARAILEELTTSSTTPRAVVEDSLLDARVALARSGENMSAKLQRILALGRSGRFIRTIADEGPALAAAVAHALRHQPADDYSDALAPVLERAIAAAPAQNMPLFAGVTLSERELTVLRYLATRLTTREIAAELYVSMNTLRTHTKSIYRKLGAESRAGAADAARTAGIL